MCVGGGGVCVGSGRMRGRFCVVFYVGGRGRARVMCFRGRYLGIYGCGREKVGVLFYVILYIEVCTSVAAYVCLFVCLSACICVVSVIVAIK